MSKKDSDSSWQVSRTIGRTKRLVALIEKEGTLYSKTFTWREAKEKAFLEKKAG